MEKLRNVFLSKIVSVLRAIHGSRVPIEIVSVSVEKRDNGEYIVKGEYRLIVSRKRRGFVAVLAENGELKALERLERISWKHPTFEKASLLPT